MIDFEDFCRAARDELWVVIKRHGLTLIELSKKLEEIGVYKSPSALSSAINRGRFSYVLYIQCIYVCTKRSD